MSRQPLIVLVAVYVALHFAPHHHPRAPMLNFASLGSSLSPRVLSSRAGKQNCDNSMVSRLCVVGKVPREYSCTYKRARAIIPEVSALLCRSKTLGMFWQYREQRMRRRSHAHTGAALTPLVYCGCHRKNPCVQSFVESF